MPPAEQSLHVVLIGQAQGARIVHHIAQLIETDGPGGAERMVATLSGELRHLGHSVVAILPESHDGWLTRQLHEVGVPVEHYQLKSPVSAACVSHIAGVLRRHHVSVAHSHEFSMAVYGAVAARLAGAAHVITMHGSDYCVQRLRRRMAMRVAVGLSGSVASVSTRLADRLRDQLGLPSDIPTVIPNGILPGSGSERADRAELGLEPGDELVLTVGNLYPVKGHAVLLDAIALLADKRPRLHVAIAGRGHMAPLLRQQTERLGLGRRVHLLGLRRDVSSLLRVADIFALPSLSEGLPVALLEAMFAEVPIVATDVGDVARALGGGAAGLIVPPGDAPALAFAIDALLTDRSVGAQFASAAALRAADEYHARRMTARYLAAYERALRARRLLAAG